MVESRFLTVQGPTGEVLWNAFLASLDADGDGVSNGEELQDGFGVWTVGQPAPGNATLVTLPGDLSSDPKVTLTLQFTDMTPHIGQQLEIRLVDKATGQEAGREEFAGGKRLTQRRTISPVDALAHNLLLQEYLLALEPLQLH